MHSSTGLLDFNLSEQEANLSSLDLVAASVETSLKAENSTFAGNSAPGKFFALLKVLEMLKCFSSTYSGKSVVGKSLLAIYLL